MLCVGTRPSLSHPSALRTPLRLCQPPETMGMAQAGNGREKESSRHRAVLSGFGAALPTARIAAPSHYLAASSGGYRPKEEPEWQDEARSNGVRISADFRPGLRENALTTPSRQPSRLPSSPRSRSGQTTHACGRARHRTAAVETRDRSLHPMMRSRRPLAVRSTESRGPRVQHVRVSVTFAARLPQAQDDPAQELRSLHDRQAL